MLSNRREIALQGGLVMAQNKRLELEDNTYGHYRSIFNGTLMLILVPWVRLDERISSTVRGAEAPMFVIRPTQIRLPLRSATQQDIIITVSLVILTIESCNLNITSVLIMQ